MRLIDADELITTILTNDLCGDDNVDKAILNAPTVKAIPLDKPFCKMVYGDYVVYNKKWLVNHLQTEWNILQGKEYKPAIPVEWIRKWVKNWKPYTNVKSDVFYMLEDWEKENE